MEFRSCFYSSLVFFNVVVFVFSQSQPTCLTGAKAKQFNDRMVKLHNKLRNRHGVPPLKPDLGMMEGSIEWSKQLVLKGSMEHSQAGDYGENLYMNSLTDSIDESGLDPVQPWYDEIKLYHEQGFSSETGHYTQVVWKSTKKVGCGVCVGSTGTFVTCRYVPPGNYLGQFEENVLPPKSDSNQDHTDTSEEGDEIEPSTTPSSMIPESDGKDGDETTPSDMFTTEMLLFITLLTVLILSLLVLTILCVILFNNFMNYYY